VPGPQGVGQPFEVRHGHGERRVAISAKRRWHLLREMDAHPRVMVRSKAQAVVDHGLTNTERGPPAVVPGDVRLSDVCQRRLDLDKTEGRQEGAFVGERDAVFEPRSPKGTNNGKYRLSMA